MVSCSCLKFIFLAVGILLGIGAILLMIFGYLVALIQSSDYALELCTILGNRITHPDQYHGLAMLSYLSLNKELDVFTSTVEEIVRLYLDSNYRMGSKVQCLVSYDDIKLTMVLSDLDLIFVIIMGISSIICISIFVAVLSWEKRKRAQYVELTEAGARL